jgi:hypothetical protein
MLPAQIVADPVMVAGVAGMLLTLTASVCGELLPQESLAVTVIFPLLMPAMAVILFVEPDPVHPAGNVHV